MTTQPSSCPSCNADRARYLAGASHDASVYYFRCDGCGHVWAIQKDGSGGIRHVHRPKEDSKPDA